MKTFFKWFREHTSMWTPEGLLFRALIGILALAIFHLLGFREYTTILSGTSPSGGPISSVELMKMVLYLFSYLYATIVTPILCIAAGLLFCFRYNVAVNKTDADMQSRYSH